MLNSSGLNSFKGQSKAVDLSSITYTEPVPELDTRETIDHIRFYLKSQLKVPLQKKIREVDLTAHKDSNVSMRLKTYQS